MDATCNTKNRKMELKEFLISIGRLTSEEENLDNHKDEKNNSLLVDDENTSSEYQTVGEIFDYYKRQGREKLPDNVVINIPNFPGYPL